MGGLTEALRRAAQDPAVVEDGSFGNGFGRIATLARDVEDEDVHVQLIWSGIVVFVVSAVYVIVTAALLLGACCAPGYSGKLAYLRGESSPIAPQVEEAASTIQRLAKQGNDGEMLDLISQGRMELVQDRKEVSGDNSRHVKNAVLQLPLHVGYTVHIAAGA